MNKTTEPWKSPEDRAWISPLAPILFIVTLPILVLGALVRAKDWIDERLVVIALCLALTGCAAHPNMRLNFASKERRDWDYAVAAICQEKGVYFVTDGKQTDRLYRAGKTPQQAFEEMRKAQ